MSSNRIALVCDDHGTRVKTWTEDVSGHLGSGWDVEPITGSDLASMVEALSSAELPWRDAADTDDIVVGFREGLAKKDVEILEMLDSAELIVLDSDLTPNSKDSETLGEDVQRTLRNQRGETLARQIRSYTGAGVVVVVNRKYSSRFFDLSMVAWASGFADLYITGDDVAEDALWLGSSAAPAGYNPWSWPVLTSRVEHQRVLVDLLTDLDAPLFETLGLALDDMETEQLDILSHVSDPSAAVIRDLAYSELGFRFSSKGQSDDQIRRMSASVLFRWLDRLVVPAQNVLVDLPHLISRFPMIFKDSTNVDTWTKAAQKTPDEELWAPISGAISIVSKYYGRPVFDPTLIREIVRSSDPVPNVPELVFAEDTSSFFARGEVEQVTTQLPGPHFRRFIRGLDDEDKGDQDIDYLPSLRRR